MFLDKDRINKFGGRLRVIFVGFILSIGGGIGMMNEIDPKIGLGVCLSGFTLIILGVFLRGRLAEIISNWVG